MQSVTKLMIGLGVALVAGACTDTASATDLNPAGPPMLRQVRMNAKITNADGSQSTKRVFAFGTHELASPDELMSNQVTSANAVNNSFRLIIDELLVGNNLEEVACRAPVDDDSFSRVPIGATPDDIARCAVADDALAASCGGPTAVCLCNIPGGCMSTTGEPIAEGAPVGVLDINQDGATDDTQFIAGSVGIKCGDIDVPINLDTSYWNPSGDQNKPAVGGFEALGPAVVLTPGDATHGASMPTGLDCQITASPSIVDKQGEQLCAPTDGGTLVDGVYVADCPVKGDLSAFHFSTEALNVRPVSFSDGGTGVSVAGPLTFAANAPLLTSTVTNTTITMTEGGAPFTGFTPSLTMPQVVIITFTNPLQPTTTYTVTVTQQVTDTYDQPQPAASTYTFTTGS